ncbi:TatD family hydrolase [Thiolinea disciformis]|uniref:TatD family hydrolase n=1 Tax=Thiolinea disciformis TaxID=125614 RepID=UPI000382335C|nr:TatD family hydrolase [Thiolinea disciformis]
MRLIDTHCHFDDESFDCDRVDLLQQMREKQVSDLILPAITAASWKSIRHLAQQHAELHASFGLHPIYLAEHRPEHLQQLQHYLEQGEAVALGECGLDFFIPELDVSQQIEYFVAQLRLAKHYDLPLIIHARRSVDQVIKYIRRIGGLRGVIHSFAGSQQQVDSLMEQGFYVGIGGTVTYERAQRLRRIVAALPSECLLLETDAPDQPDSQWRGKRNTPLRLPIVAETVAALRGVSVEEVAAFTSANAQRLFGIT